MSVNRNKKKVSSVSKTKKKKSSNSPSPKPSKEPKIVDLKKIEKKKRTVFTNEAINNNDLDVGQLGPKYDN